VLASFGAVAMLVGAVGALRTMSIGTRRRGLHLGVGAWVLFVTPRFEHLGWALVPPLAFVAVNASRLLRERLPELASDPAAARGLWAFPLGVALTYLFFWSGESRHAILAGIAALTFADPAAAWVGRRWGQRRYRGFGFGRTLEGTLAFLAIAALAGGWLAARQGSPVDVARAAVLCGGAGAGVEALAPPGWDNIAIPLAVAAVYAFLA